MRWLGGDDNNTCATGLHEMPHVDWDDDDDVVDDKKDGVREQMQVLRIEMDRRGQTTKFLRSRLVVFIRFIETL